MTSIQFGASHSPLSPEQLNHRTASPLRQNQIQFYVGGHYLSDFSNEGIERFVKQSDKNLDPNEVKAFIQKMAQNADQVKGMAFDLTDPELGLSKDDKIEKRHIEAAFTLDVHDRTDVPESLRTATDIRFVDADVHFALKEKEDTIASAQSKIEQYSTELKDLKTERDSSREDQSKAVDKLKKRFDNPQEVLKTALARQTEIPEKKAQLKADLTALRTEREGLPADNPRRHELDLMIRGGTAELKALDQEADSLKEKLSDGWTSLNDLQEINTRLQGQEAKVTELEGKISAQRDLIEKTVKAPSPTEPLQPTESPAATDPAQADPKAVPAQPAAESETVKQFKTLPPRQQATQLASMTQEQRAEIIPHLNQESREALKQEINTYVERLGQTHISSVRQSHRSQDYQQVLKELDTLPFVAPPAPADKPADQPADQPADTTATPDTGKGDAPAPTEPTPETETITPTAPSASPQDSGTGISVDDSGQPPPAGALTSKGKALQFQGKVLTQSDFGSLNAQQKFDVLMKCDVAQLQPLLQSMTATERAQIRGMATQVVNAYESSHSSGASALTQNADGSQSFVVNSGGQQIHFEVDTSAYMSDEYYQRAQLLVKMIDQMDGPPSNTAPQVNTPTASGDIHLEPAQTIHYTVKPGDTAESIAQETLGSIQRTQEIFVLNPTLEAAMRQRGKSDFYKEDISQYQAFKELILSRTPLPDIVENAPVRDKAAN